MKVNASEILLIDVTFYPQNGKKMMFNAPILNKKTSIIGTGG